MKSRKKKGGNKKTKYFKFLSITSLGILIYIIVLFLFFYFLNSITESFQTVLWSFLTLLKTHKTKKQANSLAFRFIRTRGGNRTHTPERTGFWIQRVYQFRHSSKKTSANLKNILGLWDLILKTRQIILLLFYVLKTNLINTKLNV